MRGTLAARHHGNQGNLENTIGTRALARHYRPMIRGKTRILLLVAALAVPGLFVVLSPRKESPSIRLRDGSILKLAGVTTGRKHMNPKAPLHVRMRYTIKEQIPISFSDRIWSFAAPKGILPLWYESWKPQTVLWFDADARTIMSPFVAGRLMNKHGEEFGNYFNINFRGTNWSATASIDDAEFSKASSIRIYESEAPTPNGPLTENLLKLYLPRPPLGALKIPNAMK